MEILAPIRSASIGASKIGSSKRFEAAGEMTRRDLEKLAADRPLWMDVGCGDARFPYRLARRNPDWLVVGLDAAREPMAKIASRAVRPSRKHAAPNLVLVVAAVESIPEELFGLASRVTVLFPWGSLLRSVVLGETGVVTSLCRLLAGSGSRFDVLLNDSLYEQAHVYEKLGLVRLTEEHLQDVVGPSFAASGLSLAGDWLQVVANRRLPFETTWGKRLSDSHPDGISWHLTFQMD